MHASANPPSVLVRLRLAAGDIKLAHSVFALPFAILGAFLARPDGSSWGRFAGQLGLVVVCMVLARSWAMLVNRLVDRRFDGENPRTARRVFASGRVSARDGWIIALASAGAFVGVCLAFNLLYANPWPVMLAVPVLGWIAFYSLTKRFTVLCHVVLGVALGISPLASALAVHPASIGTTPAIGLLAGMVILWVAGFDVIYALQDADFDRRTGLSSLPARLGAMKAVWISRGLHAGALTCLVLGARSDARFGPIFGGAVALVGALLITEHVVLTRQGLRGLNMAFFTLNGVISCVLGLAGVIDLLG